MARAKMIEEGDKQLFPIDRKEGEPIYDQENMAKQIPEVSGLKSMEASFDLSKESTPVNSINRMDEIYAQELKDEANEEMELSVEQLNQRYPESRGLFREPKTAGVAEIINNRNKKRKELEKTIAAGPKGWEYTTGNFVAGMAPHVIDPINLGASVAISLATPMAVGAIGVSAATASRLGLSGSITGLTARQAFVRGTVEGVIGNAIVEPLDVMASMQDLSEVSFAKSATNIFAGAIAFPGLVLGAKATMGGFKRLSRPRNADIDLNKGIEHIETNTKLATTQLMNDQNVNLDITYKQFIKEMNESFHVKSDDLDMVGVHRAGLEAPRYLHDESGYTYRKINIGEDIPVMFAAGKRSDININSPKHVIGGWRGTGIYLTDNLTLANAVAASSSNRVKGSIFDLNLSGKVLIDLDGRMPNKALNLVRKFNKQNDLGIDFGQLKPETTAKEIMDVIADEIEIKGKSEDLLDRLNSELRRHGYDGFLENGNHPHAGIKSDHNRVMLFNTDKIEASTVRQSSGAFVNRVGKDEFIKDAEALHSHKSDIDYDPVIDDLIAARDNDPYKPMTIAEQQRTNDALTETIDALDSQGLLDAADREALDLIKRIEKEGSKLDDLIKDVEICVRING